MKQSTIKKNAPRYVLLWGTLLAIIGFATGLFKAIFPALEKADPEAYCPMGGLEALATYGVRGSLPCSMSSLQIMMGIGLGIAVILFSKLFCAYFCPIGAVEDLLVKLRNAFSLKSIQADSRSVLDKALRIVKYGLVFVIFYFTCTASELFCKKIDPYYAVATGFKGEIVLWVAIVALVLVVLGGLVINNFWCRYICPLGAISNSLKFYLPLLVLPLVWWGLNAAGLEISWIWLLGALCLAGYLFEILWRKPFGQVIHVYKDNSNCSHCHRCVVNCPYSIDLSSLKSGKVSDVDCTLCGECISSCNKGSLEFGVSKNAKGPVFRWIPAILAVVIGGVSIWMGGRFEIPTISEEWGVEQVAQGNMKSMTMTGLITVKCFGSSKAFKARAEKIPGIHGVKTYVKHHKAVVEYDSSVITPEQIEKALFVPSHFRVNSPDPKTVSAVKVQTIRVEKMYDKMSLNYLGLQMRLSGKKVYGVDSRYDCPVAVKVYMDMDETLDEKWYKEIVNKKSLDMPIHGGGVKKTPVDLEFVRMEEGLDTLGISEYLHMMFDGFSASFSGRYPDGKDSSYVEKRALHYAGVPQKVFEVVDVNFEKPLVLRGLPFLSNWLSSEEGVISLALELNSDLLPAIHVRYCAPMTEDRLWEMMTAPKWQITYKDGEVKEEDPRMSFKERGHSYDFVAQ